MLGTRLLLLCSCVVIVLKPHKPHHLSGITLEMWVMLNV